MQTVKQAGLGQYGGTNLGRTMLVEDLQIFQRQFQAIKAEAQELILELTEPQFYWQPNLQQWSIAHCLDHLVVTGRDSLSNMYRAIEEARASGSFSRGPFRYGLLERWFVRQMEPPPRLKIKAPKAYAPKMEHPYADIVSNFFLLQDDFLKCLDKADGIDLSRVKVSNPVSRWMKFSLGQEIAFNAAHERRHLWQIKRIKEHEKFPRVRIAS
jgi:hypothetical protein